MSLLGLSLGLLALIMLGMMVLLGLLVRYLMTMVEQHSSKVADLMAVTTEAMSEQTQVSAQSQIGLLLEMKKILNESSTAQQSTTVGLMKLMLGQQELLINRLIAKDAVTVQSLDYRQMYTTSQEQSESNADVENPLDVDGYISGSDEAEAARYADFARTGHRYDPPDEDGGITEQLAGIFEGQ